VTHVIDPAIHSVTLTGSSSVSHSVAENETLWSVTDWIERLTLTVTLTATLQSHCESHGHLCECDSESLRVSVTDWV